MVDATIPTVPRFDEHQLIAYFRMMGRWVSGLGVGALSLMVPMYQAETAPRHIRGALISTYQLFITLGIFLASCFNYAVYEHQRNTAASWRIVIGIGFVWAFILGAGILLFPETPRYAYRKGRTEEAKATMCKVYGAPPNHYSVYMELEEIEAKLRAESNKQGPIKEWISMFSAPRMAYRIALGMTLQMFQQLTGANYFFYYGTVIFKATGINNRFALPFLSLRRYGTNTSQFRNSDDIERNKFRNDVLRALHSRALRPAQIPDGRLRLDVHLLPNLRVSRTLQPRPQPPGEHAQIRRRHDLLRLLLYIRLRHHLGSDDLDHRRRTIPEPLPREGHGPQYREQLAVELPAGVLHTLHYWGY